MHTCMHAHTVRTHTHTQIHTNIYMDAHRFILVPAPLPPTVTVITGMTVSSSVIQTDRKSVV